MIVTEDPFVANRGLLFTVSYEMLGSAADAEDVVQETWLRWDAIGEDGRAAVQHPRAFLVRMVARKALDRQRSNARRREEYVGEWLPEPLTPLFADWVLPCIVAGFDDSERTLAGVERLYRAVAIGGVSRARLAAAAPRTAAGT